ncbi:class F sortase [Nakamurella sp. A5-74]|uniref:Class F sortase n=1 Tax=Nakamurella sp. A5-74 TaxID=3158264 RepID=A0AAU8DN69_9ACTN
MSVKGPILPESEPTTLTIPAIGVTDSPVLNMSAAADGSIEVPPLDDTKSSGWFNGSPTPGEIGPSILLGHVDSRANGPSVFYKLGDLKPGDEIQVARRDGTVATFKVDGVREYAKDKFPTQVVYGNLDHAGLRLITCGGTFNPSVGHYESNIVAFATLVS